jgi:MFS family permease
VNESKAPRAMTSPVWLVALMSLSLFINYVDRGNLATAGPKIQLDLGLSATQFGLALSGFYLTYTLMQLPSGWLSDRYGAKIVLAVGAACWSLATFLTGYVTGLTMLVALRLLLGIGESAAFTTTSKLIAANVPRQHVGLANGVVGFGYLFGPAIGTYFGGKLIVEHGWRDVFILFGTLSLLWLIPWSRVRVAEPRITTGPGSSEAPTLREILRERGLWGAAIGHFAGNYAWYFILGWMPTYLVKARGFSMIAMATTLSAAYLINALSAVSAGWALDAWVRSGRSATPAYKTVMGAAHIAGLFCIAAMPFLPARACIVSFFVYEVFLGLSSPAYFSIPQLIAGPTAAARWVGVQNMIGNLPGIIGLVFAGILIDAEGGSYVTAFALAAGVNFVGLLGWCVILQKIEPIDWAARRAARAASSGLSR